MGLDVSFGAMSPEFGSDDLMTSRQIVARMHHPADVIEDDLTVPELIQTFAQAKVVVAMRMHATILTLVAGSRVVMIPYSAKGTVLASRMGLQDWSLGVGSCTADLLVQKVRGALAAGDGFDRRLQAARDRMRLEALRSFDLVDDLAARLVGRR